MILEKLHVWNFMPYKGEQTLSFAPNGDHNTTIIFGDNMRGKTALLNAIRWTLYGGAIGRHLKRIPRVKLVNAEAAQDGEWNLAAELHFTYGGASHILKRSIEKRALVSTPNDDSDFTEDVTLTRNGTIVSKEDAEQIINSIMPETISRFFLFDGELLQEYEQLVAEESQQGARIKEAIEKVLGVPALINARIALSVIKKKAIEKQAKEGRKHTSVQALSERLDKAQADRERVSQETERLRGMRDGVVAEIEQLEDELERTSRIEGLSTKLDAVRSQLGQAGRRKDDLRRSKAESLRNVWIDLVAPRLDARAIELEQHKIRAEELSEKRGALVAEEGWLRRALQEEKCSTCGQAVNDSHADELNGRLASVTSELEKLTAERTDVSEAIALATSIRRILGRSVRGRLESIEKDEASCDIEEARLESERDDLQKQIASFDTTDIAKKRSRLQRQTAEKGAMDEKVQREEGRLKELDADITAMSRTIERTQTEGMGKINRKVRLLEEMHQLVDESVDELRDRLRDVVQANATKAFLRLTTEQTYKGLRINNNYGLQIVDRNDEIVSIRSAGAEQIVALSLIDGLNRAAAKEGPVVMDTPFGRLDPKHRKNVLTYLPDMAGQVVLLVHEGEIDRERDLPAIIKRIGASYEIRRISSSHSQLAKG